MTVSDATTRVVVTDANVLINLIHVSRLHLCADLSGYEFLVPKHVAEEITLPEQKRALREAVKGDCLRVVPVTGMEELTLYAELRTFLGRGEAACLALAATRKWMVASDEKRRFRREAVHRLGEQGVLRTEDIYQLALEKRLLTVAEADEDKAVLEEHRYVMDFGSFEELVGNEKL